MKSSTILRGEQGDTPQLSSPQVPMASQSATFRKMSARNLHQAHKLLDAAFELNLRAPSVQHHRSLSMADPISLSTGLLALVTFSVQSVDSLVKIIQDFQQLPSTISNLKDELKSLEKVLSSLEAAMHSNSYDFSALRLPVQHCGHVCEEFKALILKCTSHSDGPKRSFRDLFQLKYRGDNIDTFRRSIESYKGTISIALADANLQTSRITWSALEQYRDMIQTTSLSLELRLETIETSLAEFSPHSTEVPLHGNQWQVEEKQSIEQCIQICDKVAQHLKHLSPSPLDDISVSTSAREGFDPSSTAVTQILPVAATISTLQNCSNQVQITRMWLKSQVESKKEQLHNLPSSAHDDKEETKKHRLLDEIEGLRKGIEVCEKAEKKAEQRQNTFNRITAEEDSRQIMVSTVGDLIFANDIKIGARSTQIFGQMSDASLQHSLRENTDR